MAGLATPSEIDRATPVRELRAKMRRLSESLPNGMSLCTKAKGSVPSAEAFARSCEELRNRRTDTMSKYDPCLGGFHKPSSLLPRDCVSSRSEKLLGSGDLRRALNLLRSIDSWGHKYIKCLDVALQECEAIARSALYDTACKWREPGPIRCFCGSSKTVRIKLLTAKKVYSYSLCDIWSSIIALSRLIRAPTERQRRPTPCEMSGDKPPRRPYFRNYRLCAMAAIVSLPTLLACDP